ncbi:MAG: hypothetical protein AAF901_11060 [Bacteroidota bacterium]
MKNLVKVLGLAFLIGLCFNVEMNAQSTRTNAYRTASQSVSPQQKKAKFISSRKLKEGRSYVRLGNTRLQIVKSRGRVVSMNPISTTGKMGPNMLKSNSSTQGFTCIGHLCICFGDDDCNDMFVSNACSSDIDDAACVDDVCVCNTN